MRERKRVYVAGAYNGTCVNDVLANMRRGIALSVELLKRGFAPFCPWLDFQFGLLKEVTREEYLEYSLSWLQASDVLCVIRQGHEKSEGTLLEIERAKGLNIPIYFDDEFQLQPRDLEQGVDAAPIDYSALI